MQGAGITPVSYTHLDVYKRQSLYPRFRAMMESNDYAGLDQCLAGMDALDEEFAEAVKQQIILRAEDVSDVYKRQLPPARRLRDGRRGQASGGCGTKWPRVTFCLFLV